MLCNDYNSFAIVWNCYSKSGTLLFLQIPSVNFIVQGTYVRNNNLFTWELTEKI